MSDMITIPKEEWDRMQYRLKKMATERSYAQLIHTLVNNLSAVSGLENVVESIIRTMSADPIRKRMTRILSLKRCSSPIVRFLIATWPLPDTDHISVFVSRRLDFDWCRLRYIWGKFLQAFGSLS